MSELSLPRPGPIRGIYPEREDERISRPDQLLANAMGWLRQRFFRKEAAAPGFLRKVRRAETRLADLDNQAMSREVEEVRRCLRSNRTVRLQDTARVFAIVRVIAERRLGIRPFDVQLLGGLEMLRGKIVEMDTGEGKTLTATFPAAAAALGGAPVHIITVNDFLATRDADWMRPIYASLGLSVGVITEGLTAEERRSAYACDVVYATNKQIAFDYLKDRIALGDETRPLHIKLQELTHEAPRVRDVITRGLCFAIVDEADSCLVDEARTPLVISRAGDMQAMETTYRNAILLASELQEPRDYVIAESSRQIKFTDIGRNRIRRLSETWGGVWAASSHREELARQAIAATRLYEKDKHYIVQDGHIAIVDEYTGRIMADRSWERGLHQMIEVKEGLEITGSHETVARISYQRFFRRYLHLCGMTGTAREISGELWSVYERQVQRIPPNKPSRRKNLGVRIYTTEEKKRAAVVRLTRKLKAKGRPVLVGTRSVAASEGLSLSLTAAEVDHALLNARQDKQEADVVARAGLRGAVTVATNMAGRGTDISLDRETESAGGLFVIATEPHDARRIDRQLFGRCGRQGDRGAHVMAVSLEDDIVRNVYGDKLMRLARWTPRWRGRVPGVIFRPFVRQAQRSAERRNWALRKQLLRYDDSLEDMLAFAGRME